MNNSIKLIKFFSGISKGLNIANNVIPIYRETKPLINKFQTFCNNFKLNNIYQNNIKTPSTTNITNNKKKIITNNSNNPTFFF